MKKTVRLQIFLHMAQNPLYDMLSYANLFVLVGTVKMPDRVVREMFGL